MLTSNLHVSSPSFVIEKNKIQAAEYKKFFNRYANATLNQPCIIENTTYVNDLHAGNPNGGGEAMYLTTIIKHNCRSPGLFCDPEVTDMSGPTCQPTRELKKSCRFDAECTSVR
jgi:hypothetical protein